MKEKIMWWKWRFNSTREKVLLWFVWRLPKTIVYWSTIRLMTSVNQGCPDDLKPSDYLKAWN